MTLRLVWGLTIAALVTACSDPTHDAEVNALGPEPDGGSPGPMHRPGQPCLTCHGGLGPASVSFVTAGTIYNSPYPMMAPLANAEVHLSDSTGSQIETETNAVGNFYVPSTDWNPIFPLGGGALDAGDPSCSPSQIGVALAAPVGGMCTTAQTSPTTMMSAIDRGGVYASCSFCHFDPPGPTSVGHVYYQ